MFEKTAFPVIDLAETGRCIERQRRLAGLTVRDLQTYFGFEYPQAIYKWQHGECLPTVDNLLALARILRVSMEDLLVYKDQEVFHFLLIWGLDLCPGTVPLSCGKTDVQTQTQQNAIEQAQNAVDAINNRIQQNDLKP